MNDILKQTKNNINNSMIKTLLCLTDRQTWTSYSIAKEMNDSNEDRIMKSLEEMKDRGLVIGEKNKGFRLAEDLPIEIEEGIEWLQEKRDFLLRTEKEGFKINGMKEIKVTNISKQLKKIGFYDNPKSFLQISELFIPLIEPWFKKIEKSEKDTVQKIREGVKGLEIGLKLYDKIN